MKIVVDNKIWAAYLLSGDSQVEKLLHLINDKQVALLTSTQLLLDLAKLLNQPPIRQYLTANIIESFLQILLHKSTITETNIHITEKTNKVDQPYADLAVSAKTQYLITTLEDFHRFAQLDGYKLINVIELDTFVENIES